MSSTTLNAVTENGEFKSYARAADNRRTSGEIEINKRQHMEGKIVLAVTDSRANYLVIDGSISLSDFVDKVKEEKVEELMRAGLDAWYQAANEDMNYENAYFSSEEISQFYCVGYAEPTMELLERYGIDAEVIDVEYDKNDEVINADKVIYY